MSLSDAIKNRDELRNISFSFGLISVACLLFELFLFGVSFALISCAFFLGAQMIKRHIKNIKKDTTSVAIAFINYLAVAMPLGEERQL
jgi:uncharacterized membrane protein